MQYVGTTAAADDESGYSITGHDAAETLAGSLERTIDPDARAERLQRSQSGQQQQQELLQCGQR